jgi:predicted alpha/beta-fold hydrolase
MNAGDAPSRSLYRRAILAQLNRCYAEAAARKRVPTPIELVRQARCCSEWNELAIVPRFRFRSVCDYYRSIDVIPGLHTLDVPCLIVASENDPIVPAHIMQAALAEADGSVTMRWARQGGHLAFPARVSLGVNGPLGLENQLFNWFADR